MIKEHDFLIYQPIAFPKDSKQVYRFSSSYKIINDPCIS